MWKRGRSRSRGRRVGQTSWPVVGGLPVNSCQCCCQCCVLCRVRYAALSKSESAANHEPTQKRSRSRNSSSRSRSKRWSCSWSWKQQTWPGPDKKHCKLGSTNKVPSRLALGWTAGQAGRKTDRQVQGVGQGKIARRKIQYKERGRGGWGGQCCTRN